MSQTTPVSIPDPEEPPPGVDALGSRRADDSMEARRRRAGIGVSDIIVGTLGAWVGVLLLTALTTRTGYELGDAGTLVVFGVAAAAVATKRRLWVGRPRRHRDHSVLLRSLTLLLLVLGTLATALGVFALLGEMSRRVEEGAYAMLYHGFHRAGVVLLVGGGMMLLGSSLYFFVLTVEEELE